ncbi:MAG: hypothetical protein CUN52_05540 [Phototrophicales bacterium]|nr:MAG: hypothetical protein CUN52_05540 [Phototrophicales bacterium]
MSDSHLTSLHIPVDPEPTSFRLVVLFAFLGGLIGGIVLADMIFRWGVCSLVGLLIGIAVGAILTMLTERFLKPIWKSNRFVRVTPDEIVFLQGERVKRAINPRQQVNVTQWRFTIKRRARVEKGWYVVAIALEQDDVYLPVYTLVSPERYEAMSSAEQFAELTIRPEDLIDKNSKGTDIRLSGTQRQLYIAETARGLDGVEMLPDDFEIFLRYLHNNFYRWMP